jgi:anti-sigma regulatory factor (Ser/Thr protein kinase)
MTAPEVRYAAVFGGRTETVPQARAWTRRALTGLVPDEVLADAVVVVTELATNAVAHTRTGTRPGGAYRVEVAADTDRLWVTVTDDGPLPGRETPALDLVGEAEAEADGEVEDECGRGLRIVDALADTLSSWQRTGRHEMTAELAVRSPALAGGGER